MNRLASLTALLLVSMYANAALLGRAPLTPSGTNYQAYYDSVLNITWLADANAGAGSIYDDNVITSTDGRMYWHSAQAWISSLNSAEHLGVSNWRLPAIVDTGAPGCVGYSFDGTDCGYNVQTKSGEPTLFENGQIVYSEMAHLYYVTLGNIGYYNTNGSLSSGCVGTLCLTNQGPFANLQPDMYWSTTTYAPDTGLAWAFGFLNGGQDRFDKPMSHLYAWAVHDGDVLATTVPVQGAIWFFGSAIGVMGWMRRRTP